MAGEPQSLFLPKRVDADMAVHLLESLLERKHGAIAIDASRVRQLSTLSVQVLLSARKRWNRGRLAFSITNPSAAFQEGVKLLGADVLLT